MKLVVTISKSDYECSFDKVIPIEYESAEAFIVHLDDQIKNYIELLKQYEKDLKLWDKQEPRRHSDRWGEWYKKRPAPVGGIITVGKYRFWSGDFLTYNYNGTHEDYALPNVQTLDEWFESGLAEAEKDVC